MRLDRLEDTAGRAAVRAVSAAEREAQLAIKDALNKVRSAMVRAYAKYERGGVLTKAEMTRYNRLATLEAEMLSILDPALAKTKRVMVRIPAEAYEASFFRHAWAIDQYSGLRLKWGTVNVDAIKANLDNEMAKISIEKYGNDARILVRQAINKGLPVGKSMPKMAKDIKEAFDTTAYRALRIIRTEGMTALNAGQEAAYGRAVENGVEGSYVWDATLDGRTRPTHAAKDQEKRDEATGTFKPLDGVRPRYPLDENLSAGERINCRCRLRFEVSGYAPLLRRTREEGLVPYQDFNSYAKEYHPDWLKRKGYGG